MTTRKKTKNHETCIGLLLIVMSLFVLPKALLYGGMVSIADSMPFLVKSGDATWANKLGSISSLIAFMLYSTVLCSFFGGIGLLLKYKSAVRIALFGQTTLFIVSIWFLALGRSFLSLMLPFISAGFLIAYLTDLWLNGKPMKKLKARFPRFKKKMQNTFHKTRKKPVA